MNEYMQQKDSGVQGGVGGREESREVGGTIYYCFATTLT